MSPFSFRGRRRVSVFAFGRFEATRFFVSRGLLKNDRWLANLAHAHVTLILPRKEKGLVSSNSDGLQKQDSSILTVSSVRWWDTCKPRIKRDTWFRSLFRDCNTRLRCQASAKP